MIAVAADVPTLIPAPVYAWAKEARAGDASAKAVLCAAAWYAGADGLTFASAGMLAHHTELHERSVRRALERLEAGGLVRLRARKGKPPAIQLLGPFTPDAPTPGAPPAVPAKRGGFWSLFGGRSAEWDDDDTPTAEPEDDGADD